MAPPVNDHSPGPEPKPSADRRSFLESFHSPAVAWVILLISTLLTGLGWWVSQSYVEQRAQERFSYEVDRAEQLILRRMRVFERMMIGARGLHYASTEVTREDWRNYVAALRLPEYYPGVQGFGFVRWVTPGERAAYEAGVRAEGFPEFAISPPGERAEYACVTYIEPFEARNLRAFGYDLWSEPVRRAGLSLARDTGKPAMTGKMFLVQETGTNVQPGVIMLVPMYRSGQPTGTVEERRAALFGWVHAPFRLGDLMQGTLGNANPEIGFDLFDGVQPTTEAHLFNSDAEIGPIPASYTPTRTATRTIDVAGHPWTLRFHTRPEFEATTASNQPFLIAFGGLAIDVLLFAIIWSLAGLRQRAERMAEVMTVNYRRANGALTEKVAESERAEEALRTSEQRHRGVTESLNEGLLLTDLDDVIRDVNPKMLQMSGYAREELVGRRALDVLIPTAERERMRQRNQHRSGGASEHYEQRLLRKDGSEFWALIAGSPLRDADGRVVGTVGANLDITERKQAEAAVRASEIRYRSLIEHMGEGLIQVDAQEVICFVNPQVCQMLGYTENEMLGQNASTLLLDGAAECAAMAERNRQRSQGVSEGYEVRLRKKSGEFLLAWNSATPVTSADGSHGGSMAIITDISQRKWVEVAQAASHARALRQRAAITSMVFDEAMNAADPQRALQRLTEEVAAALQVERASVWLNAEDMQSMRCIDLFQVAEKKHSEGAIIPAALCPRYWHALQTDSLINADDAVGDPRTSEFAESYLIPLGITSMLDAVIQMEGNSRGVLCIEHTGEARHWEPDEESFANTAAAIVAQILAHAERQSAQAALRESEARFRVVADSAPVMIWMTGPDKYCTYVNQPWLDFTGNTQQESLGFGWTRAVHPDDVPPGLTIYDEAFTSRKPFVMEYRLRRHDGEYRQIEAHGVPRFEAGGRFAGYAGSCTDITDRQRAERQLRESEQFLDRVVKNINDVLIVDDLEGRVVYANQMFFQVFGIPDQVLDGIRIEDYVAPEWRARQRELHDRRVRGERVPDHFECEGLRRDGTRVWLEVSVVLVAEGGRTVGTQSVFRDITERKRSEARIAAFAELGQRLSAAETVRDASEIIVELADRLLGWDSCVVNLYSAEEDCMDSVLRKDLINGQRMDVPIPTPDRTVTPRARRAITSGGELTLREATEPMPAGAVPFGDSTRPSRSLLTVPIRDRARPIAILSIQSYQVHAYTAVDLDLLQALADHCGGALARIQATQDLHVSEERFRLVWENAVDGMRLTDIEGRVVAANAAFCRLMGRAREEVVGRLFSELYAEPERERILARHRERFTQHAVPSLMERRLTLWDGRAVWLAVSNCFVETDPTRPLLLSIMRDITPNRNLEEQLRHSQKMEAVGQLAGGIAHDFNNILGAIIGNVELARMMSPDDPELPVSHEAIFQASQRASDLVRQILTFSRRQEQQRQPTQLQMVTREAVNLLRATVPAAVVFERDLPVVPIILANPSELHQVTMNLCTNAWHALQGESGVIRVSLAEATVDAGFALQHPDLRPGCYVRLTVADNGCGMDSATLAHIFEPFFTTKPVGAGTGLGLAVVHGIMKNHDGGIVVTSAPGKGTTFDLYFPVFESQEVAAAAEPVRIQPGKGECILFVDDEEPLAKMGRQTLSRLGYTIKACTSPAEALTLFRQQPEQFDLVITDYNMPGMNGTTLGAQMLAIRPDIRIILTTGFSTVVTEENVRALGFRELLPKPYGMSSLGEAVARVLRDQAFPLVSP